MELKLTHLTKLYRKHRALNDVSLTLHTGVYALLGPNGAGKTTMMRMVADLLQPSDGTVCFDGKEVHALGEAFRRQLGYLPQNPDFYPNFTARELLRYFACLKKIPDPAAEIGMLLEQVHLSADADRTVGGFSGGMRRRLGIAIALLGKPSVLILDEPTAGLDPEERIRFRNIISSIGFSCIVIYATHIISDIITIAEEIILIKDGKLLQMAKPDELLSALNGQVWLCTVSPSEVAQLQQQYYVTNLIKQAENVTMRILSDHAPCDAAKTVEPNFEEVYVYWFRERGAT